MMTCLGHSYKDREDRSRMSGDEGGLVTETGAEEVQGSTTQMAMSFFIHIVATQYGILHLFVIAGVLLTQAGIGSHCLASQQPR